MPVHENVLHESVIFASSGATVPGVSWNTGAVRPRGRTVPSYG